MKNLPITVVLLYKYCFIINLTFLRSSIRVTLACQLYFCFFKMAVLVLPDGSEGVALWFLECIASPALLLGLCAWNSAQHHIDTLGLPVFPTCSCPAANGARGHLCTQVPPRSESGGASGREWCELWEKRVHADGSRTRHAVLLENFLWGWAPLLCRWRIRNPEAWRDFAQDHTVGDKHQSSVSLCSADFSLWCHLIKETQGFIVIKKKWSSLIF